jgi:protease I
MPAKGKKMLMLIEQDFEDVEVTEPLKAFKDAGIQVTIAGNGSQITYIGKQKKAKFKPDTTADKVNVQDYDALFIPGGYGPDKMRLHPPMVELVKEFHDARKIIAAICHGPQLLISAGVVKGHRMTSWPSVAIDLQNAGAEWVDEAVVMDKEFITSRGPDDIPEFTKAVINALEREPAVLQTAG